MKLRNYDIFTRLLRTRPLMLASIVYLLGCIMGYAVCIPVWIWAICTGLFLLPVISRKCRRFLPLIIIAAMLPFGAFRFAAAWNAVPVVESKDPVQLSGRIVSIPEYREDTERTICVLDDITIDGESVDFKLRLYLRGDIALLQDVQIANTVSCEAHLWQADDDSNPGQFSFRDYLRLNGLSGYATAVIEEASFTQDNYRLSDKAELFKNRLGNYIESMFPSNPALARAFLIGDRSHLSEYDRENFSKSGVAHLLAISGMHISVLAGFVSILLTRLFGRKPAFIATFIILIMYGFIIGFTASFLRALVIFTMFSVSPIAGRNYDAPTSLGAAMMLYLLIRPVGIMESGFALSFGASAGIIFLSSPLLALTRTDAFLSRRPKHGFAAVFTDRLPKWIIGSIIISLSAQIAIFPIVINNFGYQSPWTLLANLICVPLAMCAYIASIIGALSTLQPIAGIGDFLFGLLTKLTRFFSELPLSDKNIACFPVYICVICALVMFLASDLSRLSMKIRRFMPLVLVPAIIISGLIAKSGLNGCSIVFFDAGQADCAAIQCDGKLYLVDTGDDYTPAVDYMRKYAYQPEAVFLSHCHDDHVGGLNDILDYCAPKTIYISKNWYAYERSEAVDSAIMRAEELGCQLVMLSAGDEIALTDQAFLRVFSAEAGFSANSANDDSLILYFEYGEASALFTGDCSAEITAALAPDVDILKVAHHGAKGYTSAELIENTTPSMAFIPVGYNNYGHPSKEVTRLLELAGTEIYCGDECGAVTCNLDANGAITVRCYKNPEAVNGVE